jgi:membrane associated rhomboid family serine protease
MRSITYLTLVIPFTITAGIFHNLGFKLLGYSLLCSGLVFGLFGVYTMNIESKTVEHLEKKRRNKRND